MPTQEERIAALEQSFTGFQKFQQQAVGHIHEIEANMTILLGVAYSQGQDIKRIIEQMDAVDGRLEAVDGRLEAVDGRLGAMDGRLEAMDRRLDAVDGRLEAMDGRLEAMDGRLGAV